MIKYKCISEGYLPNITELQLGDDEHTKKMRELNIMPFDVLVNGLPMKAYFINKDGHYIGHKPNNYAIQE